MSVSKNAIGSELSNGVATESLSNVQKRIAAKAIEDVHIGYYERGGLRDTLERAEGQSHGVSSHIYKMAVYAAKHTSNLSDAGTLFASMCAYAESVYKREHNIENLKDRVSGLPVWSVFKSNILGAIREGLSPLSYPNEHKLRDARGAMGAALPRNGNGKKALPALPSPNTRAGPLPIESVRAWVESSAMHKSLRAPASRMLFSLERVQPSKRAIALNVVKDANGQLTQLIS